MNGTKTQSVEPDDLRRVTRANQAACDLPLQWDDQQDFDDAWRGLIADMPDLAIEDSEGRTVWDSRPHDAMLSGARPDTVHPSLWRIAQLNNIRGLFEVAVGVWQVRGHSLANMTFIAGETGWIVIDPVNTVEVAAFGLNLVNQTLGTRPVVAVVYSHTHSDHWGGVAGLDPIPNARIIAPHGFTDFVLAESLVAAEGLAPRNRFMYGEGLESGPCGHVDCGLGKATEGGTVSFLAPTDQLGPEPAEMVVDGVEMHFQFAPGEAPTGLHVWLPETRVLHMADNCYASLHNIYTIRGSLSRDAVVWSDSVDQALNFADAEVMIGGHHWPRWGKDAVRAFLEEQRDALKYLHDQAVRLMKLGYTADEAANQVSLPPELGKLWHLRGYYGTDRQNVRAIIHHYLGWYDGNPATLDPLPPREGARHMIDYMGGVETVVSRAAMDLEAGKERWVAQVLDLVLWADPDHKEARKLASIAHQRLGLMCENATWRNAYLSAAQELSDKKPLPGRARRAGNLFAQIAPGALLDYLAIRVDGQAASGMDIHICWLVTDWDAEIVTRLRNSVLRITRGSKADATVTLDHATLAKLVHGQTGPEALELDISGNKAMFETFWSVVDHFQDDFSLAGRVFKKGEG